MEEDYSCGKGEALSQIAQCEGKYIKRYFHAMPLNNSCGGNTPRNVKKRRRRLHAVNMNVNYGGFFFLNI